MFLIFCLDKILFEIYQITRYFSEKLQMLLSTSNPYHTMETQCIFITFVLMSTIMDKIFEANSSFM